jgi:hypothetical protein
MKQFFMSRAFKLSLFWIASVSLGAFSVVADELQALQWFEYYNFPLIGQLQKYGGYGRLGAWDLTFICIIISFFACMILYRELLK